MPSMDEARQSLLRGGEEVEKRVSSFWEGFSEFALSDNVLEIGVGLMYATQHQLRCIWTC